MSWKEAISNVVEANRSDRMHQEAFEERKIKGTHPKHHPMMGKLAERSFMFSTLLDVRLVGLDPSSIDSTKLDPHPDDDFHQRSSINICLWYCADMLLACFAVSCFLAVIVLAMSLVPWYTDDGKNVNINLIWLAVLAGLQLSGAGVMFIFIILYLIFGAEAMQKAKIPSLIFGAVAFLLYFPFALEGVNFYFLRYTRIGYGITVIYCVSATAWAARKHQGFRGRIIVATTLNVCMIMGLFFLSTRVFKPLFWNQTTDGLQLVIRTFVFRPLAWALIRMTVFLTRRVMPWMLPHTNIFWLLPINVMVALFGRFFVFNVSNNVEYIALVFLQAAVDVLSRKARFFWLELIESFAFPKLSRFIITRKLEDLALQHQMDMRKKWAIKHHHHHHHHKQNAVVPIDFEQFERQQAAARKESMPMPSITLQTALAKQRMEKDVIKTWKSTTRLNHLDQIDSSPNLFQLVDLDDSDSEDDQDELTEELILEWSFTERLMRSETLLVGTATDMISILLLPVIIVSFYRHKFLFDWGYADGLDVATLGWQTALQLLVEIFLYIWQSHEDFVRHLPLFPISQLKTAIPFLWGCFLFFFFMILLGMNVLPTADQCLSNDICSCAAIPLIWMERCSKR